MFLLNVGWSWSLATDVEDVRGAIFLASSNPNLRFTRNAGPELNRVLIDPQLYLAGLNPAECGRTCGRLATHPWFGVPDLPVFDSRKMGVREWQKKVEEVAVAKWPGVPPHGEDMADAARAAILCQLDFGCTHIILPVPLIGEREDEGATLGEWLDAGLSAASDLEVGQALLATVAVSEATLSDDAFRSGGFLDALADQVTAREGLSGVYIVVAQTGVPNHPFQTRAAVLRAYLHLTRAFRGAGVQIVMVNFADVFGIVAAAVGATDFASGASQKDRRLSLGAFRDEGGGVAVPHLYSHRVIGEFTSETELKRLVSAKLFRRVIDETPYSQDLIDTLATGGSAGRIPEWAESQNNLGAAQRHFVTRLAMEGAAHRKVPAARRQNAVRDWLEDAEAGVLLLKERLGTPTFGRVAPARAWVQILDGE